MKVHKIKMVTLFIDNQDGSCTSHFYNSEEELRSLRKLDDTAWQALVDEDDPYENGSLGTETIEVTLHDDGHVSIAPFSVYSNNQ